MYTIPPSQWEPTKMYEFSPSSSQCGCISELPQYCDFYSQSPYATGLPPPGQIVEMEGM